MQRRKKRGESEEVKDDKGIKEGREEVQEEGRKKN